MSRMKNSFAVFLGMISIGIIIGVVLTTNFNIDSKSVAADSIKLYTESSISDTDDEKLTAANYNPNQMFVDVIKKVRPAIVTIYTTKNVKVQPDPFFFFFRDRRGGGNEQFQQERKQRGLGSGVIISKDGYILTNNHVVGDVDELEVMLIDGREFKAELVGTDPTTEIALIKIDAENLPVAVLGNSDKLQIGEWVIAIGNPLELTSTVTAGIVSALNRSIDIIRGSNNVSGIENFIQTDAAINPGNSGGGLVNIKGEVIGINTAIATQTSYYMGYGFAVPINLAKSVIDDLIKYGEVRRGILGVYIAEVDRVTAKGVGLDKPRGVFIRGLMEGSAAEDAGVLAGDVILEVEGREVNQPNELQARIASFNPGDEVSLVIWRDKKEMNISVTLRTRDGEETAVKTETKKEKQNSLANLGLRIKDLNNREESAFEIDHGVLVVSVQRDTPAEQAQIFRGDVITEIDDEKIESVNDFNDKISAFDGNEVVKLSIRNKQGNEIFDRLVFLEIPE